MNGLVARLFAATGLPTAGSNAVSTHHRPETGPASSGVAAISNVESPWRWRVMGTIDALAIDPRGDLPLVEARVSDGTGWIVAEWRGWASLRGLRLRGTVLLDGFVEVGPEGQHVMFEPDYQIVADG